MNKFRSQLSNARKWLSVTAAVIIVAVLVAIHVVKIPMIEPWNPPVIEVEPKVDSNDLYIKIMYVTGNGVRVHDGPSEAHDAIEAFNWCKSLIVFARDREWIEIGDTEPIGWMHEGFLTDEKPDRCVEAAVEYPTLLRQAGWDLIDHVKEVNQ